MGEQRLVRKETDSGGTAGDTPEPQIFHFPLNVPASAVLVRTLTLCDCGYRLVSSKTRVQTQLASEFLPGSVTISTEHFQVTSEFVNPMLSVIHNSSYDVLSTYHAKHA